MPNLSDEPNAPRPLFGPPPAAEPVPPPPPAASVDVGLASHLERIVQETFNRRFGAQALPYVQARVLATIERDVVEALVEALARRKP